MADYHILIFLSGVGFNVVNGSAIGGWLGGYGGNLEVATWKVILGSVLFFAGLWGNVYHEEILRKIRRIPEEGKDSDKVVSDDGTRVYRIPQGGLFTFVWFPHVSCRHECGKRRALTDGG